MLFSPPQEIRSRYEGLAPMMDERVTRLWAACEAKALGRGGIAAVTEATGILGKRIWSGMRAFGRDRVLVQYGCKIQAQSPPSADRMAAIS
jgi:hypothetical protein